MQPALNAYCAGCIPAAPQGDCLLSEKAAFCYWSWFGTCVNARPIHSGWLLQVALITYWNIYGLLGIRDTHRGMIHPWSDNRITQRTAGTSPQLGIFQQTQENKTLDKGNAEIKSCTWTLLFQYFTRGILSFPTTTADVCSCFCWLAARASESSAQIINQSRGTWMQMQLVLKRSYLSVKFKSLGALPQRSLEKDSQVRFISRRLKRRWISKGKNKTL